MEMVVGFASDGVRTRELLERLDGKRDRGVLVECQRVRVRCRFGPSMESSFARHSNGCGEDIVAWRLVERDDGGTQLLAVYQELEDPSRGPCVSLRLAR